MPEATPESREVRGGVEADRAGEQGAQMTFGSLFAGIGGLDLGLERAGMVCKWQVEIDDYCKRVLGKHWPNVYRWDDVRTFPPAEPPRFTQMQAFASTKPSTWYVDLICGGFPCQDISNAGKRAGIQGDRSGLWSEFARIVGVVRPRYVLVENVAALLARGMGRVLGDLSYLGYDAEWDCLPAAAFGALHIRNRVFLLAYSRIQHGGARRQRGLVGDSEGDAEQTYREEVPADANGRKQRRRKLAKRKEDQRNANASGHGPQGDADDALRGRYGASQEQVFAGRGSLEQSDWWAVEPDVDRVADGVPSRVDRLKGLGNAVVPQVAEWIGSRILEAEKHP